MRARSFEAICMIFEQQLHIRVPHGRAQKHERMRYKDTSEQLVKVAIVASGQRVLATSEDSAIRRVDGSVYLQNNAVLPAKHIRYVLVVITSVRLKREQIQLIALDAVVRFVFDSGNRLTEQHFFEERHGQDL